MKILRISGLIAVVLGLAMAAPAGQIPNAQAGTETLYGDSKPLGQGIVRSLAVLDDRGVPVSIGISLSKEVFSTLPAGPAPSEVMLDMPEKVSVPPFDHFTVDWNPLGHEPPGIYDVPHFDFHFYLIPSRERVKISAKDKARFAKAPPSRYLPADYVATPGGVPKMGAHWVDRTSPEFHGKPFTSTFIYGTYDGAVTFYEPMMSSAFLGGTRDYSAEIKQPAAYARKGYHPVTYRVVYKEQEGEYLILLDGLTPN
ncbi:MAG TPA: DUF5602 domain-containing protein [Deltaproteobacteria bacterium]|nr:DUF5602 domain-containing protein [Deltaproteobacteria bacterium]HXK48821.1 DUF5602 domain-containing protein [Deltaproteobacteria bacterium]